MFIFKLFIKQKPRFKRKYTIEQLYKKGMASRDPKLVEYIIRRVAREWGDNKDYHKLQRHYHIITGKYFEVTSKAEDSVVDPYYDKLLFPWLHEEEDE